LNSSSYLRAILLFFTVVLILICVPVSAKSGEVQVFGYAKLRFVIALAHLIKRRASPLDGVAGTHTLV